MTPASAARSPLLLLTLALACGGDGPASPDASTTAATTSTGPGSTGGATTSGATTTTGEPTGGATTDASTTDTATTDPTTTEALTTAPDASSSTGAPGTTDATTSTASDTSSTSGETSTGDTGDTSTGDTSTGGATTGGPDGFGVLSGDCGLLDAMELESPMAYVFTGAIDFGDVGFDYDLLTPGGQAMYDAGNLNAGSLESEVVAFEVLARCDMAQLLKTEGTIVYDDPMGKKTDILVEIDGLKVGVSVVRAVGFPQDDPYTVQQATTILNKKLSDILISSENVAPEDQWVKQILSVVAYAPGHVDSLLTAYAGLDPAVKADTILVITATDGDDQFIYD